MRGADEGRYTKTLDVWVIPSAENAKRVSRAFLCFGAPMVEVTEADFAEEGLQYAIGMPPSQIDFLTSLPGTDFETAWKDRVEGHSEGITIPFLGVSQLIAAKTLAGRPQDLADLDELRRSDPQGDS